MNKNVSDLYRPPGTGQNKIFMESLNFGATQAENEILKMPKPKIFQNERGLFYFKCKQTNLKIDGHETNKLLESRKIKYSFLAIFKNCR